LEKKKRQTSLGSGALIFWGDGILLNRFFFYFRDEIG
jgi:hypothetical protein